MKYSKNTLRHVSLFKKIENKWNQYEILYKPTWFGCSSQIACFFENNDWHFFYNKFRTREALILHNIKWEIVGIQTFFSSKKDSTLDLSLIESTLRRQGFGLILISLAFEILKSRLVNPNHRITINPITESWINFANKISKVLGPELIVY